LIPASGRANRAFTQEQHLNTWLATVLFRGRGVSKSLAVVLASMVGVGQAIAATSDSSTNIPSQTKSSTPSQSPLPPGNAASIEQEQRIGRPLLLWTLGGAAIIAGVILLSKTNSSSTPSTSQ